MPRGIPIINYTTFLTKQNLVTKGPKMPVWQVRNEIELKALRAITNEFNGSMHKVDASQVEPATWRFRKGLVLGIGIKNFNEAIIYSHLTNRNVCLIKDIPQDYKGRRPEVIVTTIEYIDSILLEFAAINQEKAIIGLVASEKKEDLYLRVLVSSAAAKLCGPVNDNNLIIDIRPLEKKGIIKKKNKIIAGSLVINAELRSIINKGAPIVTLLSHSDGIDAFMGNAILCTQKDVYNHKSNENIPLCLEKGYCHRIGANIEEALLDEQLIDTSILRGRVLVLGICSGLLLPGSLADPRFGIAIRLNENYKIGAFITCWSIVPANAATFETISTELSNSLSVGKALDRVQKRNTFYPSILHRLVLFGDPAVKVIPCKSSTNSSNAKQKEIDEIDYRNEMAERTQEQIGIKRVSLKKKEDDFYDFLMNIIRIQMQYSNKPNDNNEMKKTYSILKEYRINPNADSRRKLFKSILTWFDTRDTILSKLWLTFSDYVTHETTSCCPVCNRNMDEWLGHFDKLLLNSRRVCICPACGIIQDTYPEIDFHIDIGSSNTMCINGTLPESPNQGIIHIGSSNVSDNIVLPWPCNGKNQLLRKIPLRLKCKLPGTVRLSAVVICCKGIAIAARYWRPNKSINIY
ncbi:hypothetical protein [Prochlorococcus marinus]|uniref:hypothetical protein n=1 Tax=Prochlorococcus TaxID=1218 RepID=UPI0007B3CF40|nr:hypothetical protein [Prochlorococcus marinus]KZR75466.1 hypothetical protein PMIT1323_01757 [Prochlorococcus marinus str. MIT 1323]